MNATWRGRVNVSLPEDAEHELSEGTKQFLIATFGE